MTTQAPHVIRTVVALVAGHVGLSEEKIRVIAPDIGGGFGGKVPVYPVMWWRSLPHSSWANPSSGSKTGQKTLNLVCTRLPHGLHPGRHKRR